MTLSRPKKTDFSNQLWEVLQEKQTILDLSQQNINDVGAILIADTLTSPNCVLTKLNLKDNKISDEGAKLIAEALASTDCKLVELNLDLDGNNITSDGEQLIADALAVINSRHESRFASEVFIEANGARVLNLNEELSEMDILEICALKSIDKLKLVKCHLKKAPLFPKDYPVAIINLSENNFTKDENGLKRLFLLPNLRNLNLSKCELISLPDFEPSASNIKVLTLAQNNIDNSAVALVELLPKLEILDLGFCQLEQVPNFTRKYAPPSVISMLKMDGNDLSQINIAELFELPKLEKLILDACNITSINFDPSQCALKQLSLRNNKLDHETMVRVGSIATLEELILQQCGNEVQACILALRECDKIWKLNLSGSNLAGADLRPLFKLPKLKVVSLSSCQITSLPALEDLVCSRLESINLGKNKIDDKSIARLTEITSISELELHGCMKITSDTACKIFSMPKLEVLNLSGCRLTEIKPFNTGSSKIKQLWVAGNNLNEVSFSIIAQLPLLTKLNVRKCILNQQCLAHVFSIKNLAYLEIDEGHLQDWGMKKGGRGISEIVFGNNEPHDITVDCSWLPSLKDLDGKHYQHNADQKKLIGLYDKHQGQRADFYNSIGKLDREWNEQEIKNTQKMELIEKAAVDMEEAVEKTLNVFERGSQ